MKLVGCFNSFLAIHRLFRALIHADRSFVLFYYQTFSSYWPIERQNLLFLLLVLFTMSANVQVLPKLGKETETQQNSHSNNIFTIILYLIHCFSPERSFAWKVSIPLTQLIVLYYQHDCKITPWNGIIEGTDHCIENRNVRQAGRSACTCNFRFKYYMHRVTGSQELICL